MTVTRRAFLALGSNIGDRVSHLREAIERIPDVVAVSAVYETPPISDVAQDAFLNMVVRLDTALSPHELLDVCWACETSADRVRVVHWGPRTLDVDVLWVDGETVDDFPDLLVIISTPDSAIGEVAASLPVSAERVVAHLSGSLGLAVLADHPRAATLHPLVSMADAATGAQRLRGAWFAVAGDPRIGAVVDALGGRSIRVADEDRAAYHAAAVVASNHLVAVLGQAERIAATVGVPFEVLLDLVNSSVANVAALGPAAALTGPAARGDEATIERHVLALDESERATYLAMAAEARRLAGRPPAGGS
jgi:2-amino-4-hydroxy-6-hydroxymethyldihydropteridine diphosphokinase